MSLGIRTVGSKVVLVSGSFVLYFLCVGTALSFGVIYSELALVFELGDGKTGWVASLFVGLQLGCGLVSGILVSLYGSHVTAVIGSVVMTVGMVTSGLVSSPYLLYLTYGVIAGSSSSLLLISGTVIINEEFTDRRTVAMGLASIGGSTGTMILPFFTSWCIDVYGWSGAFILLGGLCLQGVVPGVLFYSAKTKLSTSPGQKTGFTSISKRSPGQNNGGMFSFFNSKYAFFVIASTIAFVGLFIPHNLLYKMMTSKGITAISSAMALSLMGGGSIATRVFVGFLGDYTRRHRIYFLIIAMLMCGCLTVVCVRFTLFWQFWIYGVLFGACTGTIFLRPIITTDLAGVEHIGPAFGLLTMVEGIGSAVGTPFGGWLADVTLSYQSSFYFSGSCFIVCGIILAIIPLKWRFTNEDDKTQTEKYTSRSLPLDETDKQVQSPLMATTDL